MAIRIMVALKMYVSHAVEIFAQKLSNHLNAPAHPYMTEAVVYTALFIRHSLFDTEPHWWSPKIH